jgi:uncharacterized protein YndB with AHSA1/START domain/uncharacterized protein YciI
MSAMPKTSAIHARRSALYVATAILCFPLLVWSAPPDTMPPIKKQIVVKAPRADVWQAFTTREGVSSFFGTDARIELRPGGAYEIFFDHASPEKGYRGSEGCRILFLVPEELLAFTWNAPPNMPELRWQRTYVLLQLEQIDRRRTRVRVTHAGWQNEPGWAEARSFFDKTWDLVLDGLKQHLATPPSARTAAAVAKAAPLAPRKQYAYFVRPARATRLTAQEQQLVAERSQYMKKLLSEGHLIFAGEAPAPADPANVPTGMVIFEAESDADAQRVMAEDPAVKAGIYRGQLSSLAASVSRQ